MSKNDHLVSKFIQQVVIFDHLGTGRMARRGAKRSWHGTSITNGMRNSHTVEAAVTYARRITGRTANAAARTIELLAPAGVAGALLAGAVETF